MIGVFDSGHGGLTVLKALAARFPGEAFLYLGDHAHVPYGNRPSDEIVDLTRRGVEHLFAAGCRLVVLGCNTATAVAARTLQQVWLPASGWRARRHNVIGIVAPTVEAATQTAWAVTSPQYPQKYNTDTIAVLATTRTVLSGVYPEEILKRCPRVRVIQRACPDLAGAIELRRPEPELERLVVEGIAGILAETGGEPVHRAILGCTHFPLVEPLFRRHLPPFTRILSQPEIVADSLEDYLARHREYAFDAERATSRAQVQLLTTGDPDAIDPVARVFWPDAPRYDRLAI